MVKKATKKKGTTSKKRAPAKAKSTKKATAKKRSAAKSKTKVKSKKAAARKTSAKKVASNVVKMPTTAVAKKQSKAQIVAELAENTGVTKSDIKNIFAALRNLVERHLKSGGSGQIIIPELAVKIRRVQKKATKARMGRNPFTGEEVKIPAKPARKGVRATPLKSLKEVV